MDKSRISYVTDRLGAIMLLVVGGFGLVSALFLDIRFVPFWGNLIIGSVFVVAGIIVSFIISLKKALHVYDMPDEP